MLAFETPAAGDHVIILFLGCTSNGIFFPPQKDASGVSGIAVKGLNTFTKALSTETATNSYL